MSYKRGFTQKHVGQSVIKCRKAKNCLLSSEEPNGVWRTRNTCTARERNSQLRYFRRKMTRQTIFQLMREQSKFHAERPSLTGIQGIKFVFYF